MSRLLIVIILISLITPVFASESIQVTNVRMRYNDVALELQGPENQTIVLFLVPIIVITDYSDGTEEAVISVTKFINEVRGYLTKGYYVTVNHNDDSWFIFIKANGNEKTSTTRAYVIHVRT